MTLQRTLLPCKDSRKTGSVVRMMQHESRESIRRRTLENGSAHRSPSEPHGIAASILQLQLLAGNAVTSELIERNVPIIASRTVDTIQRANPTRVENITALEREVADAIADPTKWKDVALRLNAFVKPDLPTICATIPNAHLQAARTAVEKFLPGWPMQVAILAVLDARARREKVSMRPLGSNIWTAYSQVGYNVWSGEAQKNEVWKHLGGSIGRKYRGGNTCSARVSWGLNYGGFPISGAGEINDSRITFAGKAGDGRIYIVWVPSLEAYLTSVWGAPDQTLASNADVVAFEGTLLPDEVAVFVGKHHSGLIKHGYSDAYVKSDPSVMPAAVWKLPM